MSAALPPNGRREARVLLCAWLALSVILVILALPNTSVPGLFYDEAHCAGMAKDFLSGHPHPHMLGYQVVDVCGRPFPTFVQSYAGAVKSWMLLPTFAIFGANQAVLRLTALGWGLAALLIFMLWTWRWLGLKVALLAAALLALDPTYFFISVLDWGPVVPSFVCRFACFYFALRWWRLAGETPPANGKILVRAFLAGVFAGLGFFNKIDFIVLLVGVLLALLCCNIRRLSVAANLRLAPSIVLIAAGFGLAACPMFPHLAVILKSHPPGGRSGLIPDDLIDKLHIMLAMYDGSYFHRLMGAGGLLDKMFQTRAPVFMPFGLAVVAAAAYLMAQRRPDENSPGAAAFLLLATLFITAGFFMLPKVVKIHHAVLVYPFPQLLVALAMARLWRRKWAAALFVLLLASEVAAFQTTQRLICRTGGRGWWSDALTAFARQVRDRSDLTILSLDWGFNEQLAFLTDGPAVAEAFRAKMPANPRAPNLIYLLHPPEYSYYPFGQSYLDGARRDGPSVADLHPWQDREGHVAFYSLQFRAP